MLLSFNWLKDYVDIPRRITPEDLARLLTMHTVEVEKIEKQVDKFKNIVVGKILEIRKHPQADRLQLVKIDVGKEKLDIVCGAFNIKLKDFVPVALIGAVLPNGLEIKEAEVRGERSGGMLCAPDELGLGDDHSGILILEKKAKLGMNLADYLGFQDIVMEVDNKSITHRGDLWCHYGMAREIAAFLRSRLKQEFKANLNELAVVGKISGAKIKVKVEDQNLCPRYMAMAMDGVKIEPSPKWIEERLVAVGLRPINNIVDITNYVMLELGQPLHAFGTSRITANKEVSNSECEIIVRRARKGEEIVTIDGEKRELEENMLVIANEKPLAIAGVMGGEESAVNNDTTSIVLESANFDAIAIRQTAQKLGLRTESSMRFEKFLDPINCEIALRRAVELIKTLCPTAQVASNLIDEKKFAISQEPIDLDLKWLPRRLGDKISSTKIIKILISLGFGVEKGEHSLKVTIPTWRAGRDISLPEDLVEEVARIYGYDKLTPKMPAVEMKTPLINEERMLERKIKAILAGVSALVEVYNYSFVNEEQLKKMGISPSLYLSLVNPLTAHQTLLRRSLLPNLINNIKINQARFDPIALFEIGSVFSAAPGDINKDGDGLLPYQEKRIGIIVSSEEIDVFKKVKGILELLMEVLNLSIRFERSEAQEEWLADLAYVNIMVANRNIGKVVKLNLKIERELGLKKKVAVAEISFRDLFDLVRSAGDRKYKEPEKFPFVARDLAFVIDAKISYNEVRDEIFSCHEFIKEVELFDVYEGEKLGRGKRNLAFHINYGAQMTLTAEEVDEVQKKLIRNLEEKFGAKIRDF